MAESVLVTGGAGYIGSHTVVELLNAGYSVVVVDNYDNSCPEAITRVEELTGKKVSMHVVDLLDKPALDAVFAAHKISGVIHFAGLKAVGESVSVPMRYYTNNITGTLNLIEVMKKHNVYNLIFSSSCTVYGSPKTLPIRECDPIGECTNPYGKTKYFLEEIFRDVAAADKSFRFILLRYFNPIGAHKSGRIGEDPNGIPNNLLPYVTQVAVGRRPHVNVFGGDYDTKDGTGVRDYIHVVDLALGHMAALQHISNIEGCVVYNLGTGVGVSVLEVIKATEAACGHDIKYVVAPRRAGDVPAVWADPVKAETELKWKATRSLAEACADSWRWQSLNPNGFKSA